MDPHPRSLLQSLRCCKKFVTARREMSLPCRTVKWAVAARRLLTEARAGSCASALTLESLWPRVVDICTSSCCHSVSRAFSLGGESLKGRVGAGIASATGTSQGAGQGTLSSQHSFSYSVLRRKP